MTADDFAALKQQLTAHEGVRLFPYVDTVGKLTIGVGRNLTDRGLLLDEVETLLDNDIAATVGALNVKLPWFARLDPVRQRVLIDLGFNVGIAGLLGFHLMLAAVREGDYDEAANELTRSKWAKQVGDRAVRLARWMRTGRVD